MIVSRTTPLHPHDQADLDRSFNELFEAPTPPRPDPSRTIEILSPIVENPTPPFQRLIPLPMSEPLSPKLAPRHRLAPPDFRPSLPSIPAHLQHLVEVSVIPSAFHRSHKTGRPMPNWLVTGLVAFLMAIVGITVVSYLLPAKNAAAAAAPAPVPTPAGQTEAPTPLDSNVVPARLVELTGFRVRADKSGKTSIQYVVINHSDNEMRGLTAHVVLRSSSAKPFQAPVANFSVRLPSIAAMDSKDLTTLVETPIDRGVPAWTDLRAEVRIEQ